jgi:uncharacterized membrane protein
VAALLKLVHTGIAIAFVAGLIGRTIAFRHARRATSLDAVAALEELSQRFDALLVIPGSLLVLPSGIWAAVQGGWHFLTPGGHPTWVLASLVLVLTPVPFIPTVLLPARERRRRALEDARAAGRLTPELHEALNQGAVDRVRVLELAVVATVLGLMILKPF